MTISQMIDEIRENLRNSFNDYLHIPKEEIRRQILYGLQKVGRETDLFRKEYKFTTTSASTRNWASIKSSDYYYFKRILSVRYASVIIEPIAYHHYANLKDSSIALDGKTKYYVDDVNQKFGLYNFASGNGVIIDFAGIPSVSSVSDTASPITQEYEDDIIAFATYKMMLRADNPQAAIIAEYRAVAYNMIAHIQRTKSNTAPIGQVLSYEW